MASICSPRHTKWCNIGGDRLALSGRMRSRDSNLAYFRFVMASKMLVWDDAAIFCIRLFVPSIDSLSVSYRHYKHCILVEEAVGEAHLTASPSSQLSPHVLYTINLVLLGYNPFLVSRIPNMLCTAFNEPN
jgi:hypothetical protein